MKPFKLLIDGQMIAGDATMPVINPATEEVVASSPRASLDQLNQAVDAANRAFPKWAAVPVAERAAALGKIADTIEANKDELARILTAEGGKPLQGATDEITWMAGFFRYFSSQDIPVVTLEDSDDRKVEVRRLPLGPVAAIVPWNFPMSILAIKVPAALLAGNTVVLKPAPSTPLSALRFAELIADLLPAGVFNVIADANDLGNALGSHPDIRKVAFTGSTATGRKVMANAAPTLKHITLELGGNDPAIVLEDADPKAIAPTIFGAAFANSGQICFAIKRLYVHESIYDEMCTELATLADAAIVGDGMEQGTQFGPIQNKAQFDRVKELLEDTKANGTIIAGGETLDRAGYFLRPTIVRDIEDGHRIVDEEQFGPILPVVKFSDVDEVIARANASEFGLGASVWSSDVERAKEQALKLDAGTVWVNKHLELPPHIPFGGAKQSGVGVSFGEEGLLEFTQIQVLNI